MATNLGKAFEQQFRKDTRLLPDCFVYRLPDQVSGNKYTSANCCDFFLYKYPMLFLLELKSILGNTFPIANLRQYSKLIAISNASGLFKGVIIWFRDHDKIIYIDIDEITKMIKDGKKSVNIRTIDEDGYKYLLIPTKKKRIFLEGDYQVLIDDKRNYMEQQQHDFSESDT